MRLFFLALVVLSSALAGCEIKDAETKALEWQRDPLNGFSDCAVTEAPAPANADDTDVFFCGEAAFKDVFGNEASIICRRRVTGPCSCTLGK